MRNSSPGTGRPRSGSRRTASASSSGSVISTGLATRSRSSTWRSTVSHTSPRIGGGKAPPMATSAMPKAGNTAPGRKPNRWASATKASTALGSTGSAPLSAMRRRERSRSVMRRRARVASTQEKFGPAVAVPPVAGHPLHPVGRVGEEVLRRGLHEVDAGDHRDAEAPDETHVVVERQPRHHDVVRRRARRPGCSASRFAPNTRSGIITPFGSLVEPLVYWRMTSRSGSGAGISIALRAGVARPRHHVGHRHQRRVAGRGLVEGRPARGRSGRAWRRRGGCGRGWTPRTPRASPCASAAAGPSRPPRSASSPGGW